MPVSESSDHIQGSAIATTKQAPIRSFTGSFTEVSNTSIEAKAPSIIL
ncbi:MAG TPA: hypothetical protein VF884_15960 [Nitrososphaeraceae archaeon]